MPTELTSLEICAGGGGQALGLEQAGFGHAAVVEVDTAACQTLRLNRPAWRVVEADVRAVEGREFRGVDLLAGGVPCPPFSVAGKRLGADDERDLFPTALRLVEEIRPRAVLLENVPGLLSARFTEYREGVRQRLGALGYTPFWRSFNARDFGVPQLRPRAVLVALRHRWANDFRWPEEAVTPPTVGQALREMMGERGWPGAEAWADRAAGIAPTLVGGSKKHGGPDLGPTRAKQAWLALGVDAKVLAEDAPGLDFPVDGLPRLTVRMAARLQGFPGDWVFAGKKTPAYRQVGNAFPPPFARAVAEAVREALLGTPAERGGEEDGAAPLRRSA
jgi:DNA (cytosine-5)-methyltransferase 1